LGGALAAACAVLLSLAGQGIGDLPARAATSRPNIVIIMTDDQRWDTVNPRYMPRLVRRMVPGANALVFRNAFVSNPLCCPSRVTILTGTYSDATGVYSNDGSFTGPLGTGGGGFLSFDDDPAVHPTIATDLHDAGYRTALVGKYLNGYPNEHWAYTPPGWDRWFSVQTGAYYDYWAAADGLHRHFGTDPADYSTRILTGRARSFVSKAATSGEPFFLYFAPTAPHGPAVPYPADVDRFDADVASYQQPASVGEPDVSDKPMFIQNRKWSPAIQARHDRFHAAQLDTIYGVDRAVATLWDALPDNTVVLFMSDNGFEWGEHRWVGKVVPYNESIRVPMILATKGMVAPAADPSRIVVNVDVRATLEAYAGLAPVTMGEDWNDPTWSRPGFPLESWANGGHVPTYCGVRTADRLYVRYATGEEELYDEQADPLELTNLVLEDPPDVEALRSEAEQLCSGGAVYPPDWPFP